MSYWNKICGFLAIFFVIAFSATAQKNIFLPASFKNKSLCADSVLAKPQAQLYSINSIKILDQNYYTSHLGFMCKKELALEKLTKVPLRLRLGSMQQCNYLEGKK